MIHDIDIRLCVNKIFPLIHQELTGQESAADYANESRGMADLEKALTFVRQDDYYPIFPVKASYLICSIAGSQYFSNGNKRLSVTLLLEFIYLNETPVKNLSAVEFDAFLTADFPDYQWENSDYISNPHVLFLYNLAILIGDRTRWGGKNFSDVKEAVATMFGYIYG